MSLCALVKNHATFSDGPRAMIGTCFPSFGQPEHQGLDIGDLEGIFLMECWEDSNEGVGIHIGFCV